MNYLKSIIIVLALLVSQFAFSDAKDQPARKTIGLGLGGGVMAGAFGTGIDGYYKVTKDFELGLLYFSGKFAKSDRTSQSSEEVKVTKDGELNSGHLVDGSEAKYSVQQYGIYGRYFIWNSFNTSFGLVHRRIKGIFAYDGYPFQESPQHVSGAMAAGALAGLVQVGNRWSWDNGFTIGIDWIGYTIPFVQTYKEGSAGGVEKLQGDSFEDAKYAFKGATSRPMLQALMLEVGYQLQIGIAMGELIEDRIDD